MRNYYFNYYLSWKWTEKVVNNYLNSFKKFDAHDVDVRNQIYVGVYGPTQVGKTTFILSLLGINENYMQDISKALRGGQKKGDSSTVTATLYEKHDGENFEVLFPSGKLEIIENVEKLSLVLKDYREEVTSTQYNNLKEMIIKIPFRYFYSSEHDSKTLTIIDLPGDDTKNEDEEFHVEQILAKYIVLCKTILVMELGYQVNRLVELENNFIKNWHSSPDRFIIVFTQGVTNRDLKSKINNKILNNKNQITNYYKEDLARSLNLNTSDLFNEIYFFELGDSLNNIKKTNYEFYKIVKNWNNTNFKELIDQLKVNDLPESKIRSLRKLTNNIEKMKKAEKSIFVEECQNIEQSINNKMKRQRKTQELIEIKNDKKKQIEEEWLKFNIVIHYRNIEKLILDTLISYKENKKMRINILDRYFNEMIFKIDKYIYLINYELENNKLGLNNSKLKSDLSEAVNKVMQKKLDVRKKFMRKLNVEDFNELIKEFNQELKKDYANFYNKVHHEIRKRINSLNLDNQKLRKENNKIKNKIIELENNKKSVKSKIVLADEDWQEEIEKVKLFDVVLINEYKKNIRSLKNEWLSLEVGSKRKMEIYIEMNIITYQVERVLSYE